MIMKLISLSLLLHLPRVLGSEYHCGFPGTPAFGFISPDGDAFAKGESVSYSCRVGYILLGTSIRRCREDGSWTGEIPICDDSMTTLGVAFSTPAVPGSPAELAIDRNKDTCTYLSPKKPRWWRIDLGRSYKVMSVAVTMASPEKYVKFTVFVIEVHETSASYKRCASFAGKFGTSTILLSCAEGKGIKGQRVHLEDHMQTEGLFDICEVEVQVEKDTGYECGRPDRKLHSITFEPEHGEIEYGCKIGYELEENPFRRCLDTGQWDGKAPTCEAIVCDPLPSLENGKMKLTIVDGETPLEGTVANYKCDEGYKLLGDFSRLCLRDGTWDGKPPQCEAIRCGLPDGKELGGAYRLLNRTTRMGSMAVLKCRKGKIEGDDPYIICSEEGEWTESHARCLIFAKAVAPAKEEPTIVNKGAVIFGMVVAALMITIVLVSLYVVMQRRRNARKPELPCRQTEAPEAPPRPPPRSKIPLASTFMECVTGEPDTTPESKSEPLKNDSFWKTRSLPLNQDDNKEWQVEPSPHRASSLEQPFYEKVQDEDGKNDARESGNEMPAGEAVVDSTAPDTTEPSGDQNVGDETGKEATPKETPLTTGGGSQAEDGREESEKDSVPAEDEPNEVTAKLNREYAAVDYDKKRESRLQKKPKDKDDENEDSVGPALPPRTPDKEPGEEEKAEVKADVEPEKQDEKNETGKKGKAGTTDTEEPSNPEKTSGTGRKRTRAPAATDTTAADTKTTSQPRRRTREDTSQDQEEQRGFKGLRRTREK